MISIREIYEKVLKYILTKTIKQIRGIARRSLAINLSNMLGFFTIYNSKKHIIAILAKIPSIIEYSNILSI